MSQTEFEVRKEAVIMPLTIIKNFGMHNVDIILNDRLKNGMYKDYLDFVARAYQNKISKIDGITYNPRAGKKCTATFFGIGWNDAPQQQEFDDEFSSAVPF